MDTGGSMEQRRTVTMDPGLRRDDGALSRTG